MTNKETKAGFLEKNGFHLIIKILRMRFIVKLTSIKMSNNTKSKHTYKKYLFNTYNVRLSILKNTTNTR